jgi:hypothetical protein
MRENIKKEKPRPFCRGSDILMCNYFGVPGTGCAGKIGNEPGGAV